jgi:hypothetical protein
VLLAAASTADNPYPRTVTRAVAARAGWTSDQIHAIENAGPTGDRRVDALLTVASQAAQNRGHVTDLAWTSALQAGWAIEELTETLLYVTIAVFTERFVNFAGTTLDPALRAVPATSG